LVVTKYVQNVHLLDKCVCAAYFPDREFFTAECCHSCAMCMVCRFP